MLKRKNITAYSRLIIQLLFLIFMPGLFSLIFGQIKQIYISIVNGKFNIQTIFPTSIELLIIITLTIIFGRFFCGYMCAFGTINDLLYKFSSKILKIKLKVNKDIDKYLKIVKYGVLLLIVLFAWTLGYSGFSNLNPWDAFAQLIQFPPSMPGLLALLVLILIFAGALFINRFFCRYLCPLGAFLSILQPLRIVKINKNKSTCLSGCNACTRKCPMGIDLDKTNRVDSLECIQCMNCTGICPRNNAKVTLASMAVNEIILILIFLFTFSGFKGLADKLVELNINQYNTPNVSSIENLPSKPGGQRKKHGEHSELSIPQQQPENIQVTSGQYKDGTYTGSATGFKPGLTVQVTINGGKITKIEILSHNETPSYAQLPFKIIPNEIIKNQSTKVDAVSGATRTSIGIMNAVAEALKQAQK